MYNIEFIEKEGEYELKEDEKFAKVRILTKEHGHKSVKMPIENIRETFSGTEYSVIEIPSGRRVEINEIEENKEYILIPPIKGG